MGTYNKHVSPTMSMKEWILTLIVSSTPIIGTLILFVWAFTGDDIDKKDRAKVFLIAQALVFVLAIPTVAFVYTFYIINR